MTVGLCGNPNVGKSTLFNRLTGMRQHTGNWPGKTVGSAVGTAWHQGREYRLVDTPGSYSLSARSAEEECARNYILFGDAQRIVVVCDATCLQRSLVLALQILELRGDVLLCVNLLDEAQRQGLQVDTDYLAKELQIPVLGISAGTGRGVDDLLPTLAVSEPGPLLELSLPEAIEIALGRLCGYLEGQSLPPHWLARTLLQGDEELCGVLAARLCLDPERDEVLKELLAQAKQDLAAAGYSPQMLEDETARALQARAAALALGALHAAPASKSRTGERLDRVLTHRIWGIPAMALLLALVLWITVSAANVPSELLSRWLLGLEDSLTRCLLAWGWPDMLVGALCQGIWRTTAWVVSVMLPPMAIFFPLFTLLEDLGYLPRVAFNLDGAFRRCGACGKQGLCMMMGLGCNAVGVTGCRIIDSPRERLIAQLTNSFMPCNGRFPILISLLTVFFAAGNGGVLPTLLLTLLLIFAVITTFLVSRLLTATLLRGASSSFVLELPPYRKPQLGKVLLRSLLDRTLFVLGRAVSAAAPAGLLIWCLANIHSGGESLLTRLAVILNTPAQLLGLDGAILLGFVLALPANEIVVPVMLMCYTAGSALTDCSSLSQLGELLRANGWTIWTAGCAALFTVFHWPCATTILTLRRETGSRKYTLLAVLLPTACGVLLCALLAAAGRLMVA